MSREECFNKGIHSLGEEVVLAYISGVDVTYGGIPMVSVGSGMAAIESVIPSVNWVLVDPDPTSFPHECKENGMEPFMKPHFPYVKDLVASRPDIVGNCCLFLNWCDPNYSDYDSEAVELLKPKGIISIVEKFMKSNGAAGGLGFHRILDNAERRDGDYTVMAMTKLVPHPDSARVMDIRIVWLDRKGGFMNQPMIVLPEFVQSKIPSSAQENCSVM